MEKYKKLDKSGRLRLWVKFTCIECGDVANTSWRVNRYDGRCPSCKGGNQPGYGVEDFKTRANNVHAYKYDYSKVVYTNAHTKVQIVCPDHGDFWQKPSNHLALSNGCPVCGDDAKRLSRASDRPATFYVIYLYKHDLFKIGVTMKDVYTRYVSEGVDYVTIYTSSGLSAKEAYRLEALVKRDNYAYKYNGISPFRLTGVTEVFTAFPTLKSLKDFTL